MSNVLDRIKLLVIGVAIGLLCVNTNAQPISPGFNVFRALNGTATTPPYAFQADVRSGVFLIAQGRPGLTANGTLALDATTTRVLASLPLQLGATAATTGTLRFANTATMTSRNAAGTADLVVVFVGSDNFINLGDATSVGLRLGSSLVTRPTTGTFFLCVTSTGAVTASAGACSGS